MIRFVVLAVVFGVTSLSVAAAGDEERLRLQFSENAKLAGRALACRDVATAASLRAVSWSLARQLAGEDTPTDRMDEFDKRVRLQKRFAERASKKHHQCEKIAAQARENLQYTQIILLPEDAEFFD